jgi:metallo-beta-lactamase family protein
MIYTKNGESRSLVFSGDLGGRDAPVMSEPGKVGKADIVLMESTYGDRMHRTFADTILELSEVFDKARAAGGNILIPSFAVGRTQDLLYLLSKHSDEWRLQDWHVFLDSPMAIQATETYSRHRQLYDAEFLEPGSFQPKIPNFHMTRTTEESIFINRVRSGAIIIAGSGMCTGGRIRHHLKNNICRLENHVVIVGYQAYGTLGRQLVDGAETVSLWGDTYRVRASIHTIGGLSAHGDQADLIDWYGAFENKPPVYLVHGEPKAQKALAAEVVKRHNNSVSIAKYGQRLDLTKLGSKSDKGISKLARRRHG